MSLSYVEPVAIGDRLPDMAVYLDPDSNVRIPLEATYVSNWASCPDDMREAVENGITFEDE
jgi:hypothetical protein